MAFGVTHYMVADRHGSAIRFDPVEQHGEMLHCLGPTLRLRFAKPLSLRAMLRAMYEPASPSAVMPTTEVVVEAKAPRCYVTWGSRNTDPAVSCEIHWVNREHDVTQVVATENTQMTREFCTWPNDNISAEEFYPTRDNYDWSRLYYNAWVPAAQSASFYAAGAGLYAAGAGTAANALHNQHVVSAQSAMYYNYLYGALYGARPSFAQMYQEAAYQEAAVLDESAQQRAKERQARVTAAKSRAEELLLMTLTPEQREEYLKFGYFDVNVDSRRYRIKNTGLSNNVELIGADGKAEAKLCLHVNDYEIPVPDNMLTQKLLLETNEPEFLKTANKTVLQAARPVESLWPADLTDQIRILRACPGALTYVG